MPRVFLYDGREFPDPDPEHTPEEIMKSMADFFPELANADIRASKRATEDGEVDVYELVRKVGTKG